MAASTEHQSAMSVTKYNSFLRLAAFVFLVCGLTALLPARALGDVLVSTNGERFVGVVIGETATNVVFESESAGQPDCDRAMSGKVNLLNSRELSPIPARSQRRRRVRRKSVFNALESGRSD